MSTTGECRRFPTGWLCMSGCHDPAHDEFLTTDKAWASARTVTRGRPKKVAK